MAHNPHALTPFLAFYAAAGASLDRRLWELVYLRVSFLNGCSYEVQHHMASSRKVGLGAEEWKALKAGEFSGFGEAEQAAVRHAEKLAELKKYFTEQQVVNLHLLVGLANLTNRFTGPLGLELEFAATEI
jgi:AhpD family alkylhydroperoxidase